MKKMMCGALCAALLACSVGAAAAESYTVTVDGTALDLSGKTPFVSQEKVMVPLRPVAEALGYTVTWTAEDAQRVEIDNGVVHTWVTIGVDSYCRTSSTALGMGAPQSFGAAPVAMAAAGVEAVLPDFPAEWQQSQVSVIGGDLLQVAYTNGTDTILFRAANGDEDTSGDYNVYDNTWTVGNVTLKGSGDQAVLAIWQRDGVSYSLSFSTPMDGAAAAELAGA